MTSAVAAPTERAPPFMANVEAAQSQPGQGSCEQTLTLSFFFDGTGNNLDADIGTFEHSNVARLYRAHLEDDPATGRFRFYLAGIGTLFKDREVDDPGGTLWGNAFGAQGQARLDFAFARLREKVEDAERRAQNPTNKICWIKVSAFGFSRGAALARAFCRDLERRCYQDAASGTGWRLKGGNHPIEVTFLGLFDTVASAGLPPSANNMSRNPLARAVGEVVGLLVAPVPAIAVQLLAPPELKRLAFGDPGADPAPGLADGHAKWANGMQITGIVKRCMHMMAAHENRNSFALDSTLLETAQDSSRFVFPATTTESFYPGVHSDVGGGYRPGEGGCRSEKGAQLSLIPLRNMHAEAVRFVPLRPLAAIEDPSQKEDFAIDSASAPHFAHLVNLFAAYTARAKGTSVPGATVGFGGQLNAHMHLYYAWRFHAIRKKAAEKAAGQVTLQEQRVAQQEQQFAKDRAALKQERARALAALQIAQTQEESHRIILQVARDDAVRFGHPLDPRRVAQYEAARRTREQKQVAYDRIRARIDGAADDSKLTAAMDKYGRILRDHAKQIVAWMNADRSLKLRPHYAALVEAYLNEFVRGRGLDETRDAELIEFFNDYVHDSLAGFDTDETWPSDPRIVYVGSDNKLRYAFRESGGGPTANAA